MREKEWWRKRIVAAFESYFIDKYLGNCRRRSEAKSSSMAPAHPARPHAAPARVAKQADEEVKGTGWSYCRESGPRVS